MPIDATEDGAIGSGSIEPNADGSSGHFAASAPHGTATVSPAPSGSVLDRHLPQDDFQRRGNFELGRPGDMREDVAIKVHLAALPARALHHRRYGRLEPFVCITHDELRAGQPALAKRAQERRPAFLAPRVDDFDRDYVPEAAGLTP